jgi:parallel beta-helix repeat protein
MLFSSRSRPLAGSLAIALLAGCEGAPGPDPDVPCGATFPSAPDGAGEIVYVAAQCLEADANGTEAHPFVRIGDALAHAGDAATILVASGTYTENLEITRPVTIVGSSDPASPDSATLSLQAVEDTAIRVTDTDAVLIGVRVEAARGVGVLLEGGTLRLAGSVVQDTQSGSDGLPGIGVLSGMSGMLTLQDTWVTGTSGTGVLVSGAAATITGSEVRDSAGNGISLDRATGEVHISDTTVSGSVGTGIRVASSRALIEQSTVSGTLGDENHAGEGILSYEAYGPEGDSFGLADLIVRGSVISGNGRTGILSSSGTRTVLLQDNTISDNGLPGTSVFEYMAGIWLQIDAGSDPASEISGNTISGNKLAGIFMFGETYGIPVVDNTVSGTLIDNLSGSPVGDGISLVGGASALLQDNLVTASGRFGIMVDAAPAEATEISYNTIENNAEYGIVLQDQAWIATDTNTFGGNASGDVAEVTADTYTNPDRPLDP